MPTAHRIAWSRESGTPSSAGSTRCRDHRPIRGREVPTPAVLRGVLQQLHRRHRVRSRSGRRNRLRPSRSSGWSRLGELDSPFERAVYTMFLVAEVHPFDDGNGRIASDDERRTRRRCAGPASSCQPYSVRTRPGVLIKALSCADDYTADVHRGPAHPCGGRAPTDHCAHLGAEQSHEGCRRRSTHVGTCALPRRTRQAKRHHPPRSEQPDHKRSRVERKRSENPETVPGSCETGTPLGF